MTNNQQNWKYKIKWTKTVWTFQHEQDFFFFLIIREDLKLLRILVQKSSAEYEFTLNQTINKMHTERSKVNIEYPFK